VGGTTSLSVIGCHPLFVHALCALPGSGATLPDAAEPCGEVQHGLGVIPCHRSS